MDYRYDSFFYMEFTLEHGYSIVDNETGETVFSTENHRKALSKLNKFNKKRR